MPTTDANHVAQADPDGLAGHRTRLWQGLSAKLIVFLLSALVVIFALLGYGTIKHHRALLEQSTLNSAERLSDMLERSASYSMMHNDRNGLRELVTLVSKAPGVEHIRVIDSAGVVNYSTDEHEIQRQVSMETEACTGCHSEP
jgi:sensor histidine kinase regulating citrate/malate metabolism